MSGLLEKLHLKHPAQAGDQAHGTHGAQAHGAQAHGVPHTTGAPVTGAPIGGTSAYSGLNFPYSGAQNHPQYGYQRLGPQQKAERFELKAAEWQKRGNLQKAQKNREKAQRYRLRTQPGYVRQQRPQTYYVERAALYDRKAQQYQSWGMIPQYQRYQGRANRIRTKYTITGATNVQQPVVKTIVDAPIIQETIRQDRIVEVQPVVHREVDKNIVHHIEKHYTETAPSQAGVIERQAVVEQQIHTNVVNEIQPIIHRERVVPVVERTEQHTTQHIVQPTIHTHEVVYETGAFVGGQTVQQTGFVGQQGLVGQQTVHTTQYSGLNLPYTGASAHPTYGYQRLPRNRKVERFEQKAAEYERRGNMAKAQKNREKANRIRAKTQPGYVAQPRPQDYYLNRANQFDQRALQYQQWGMAPQAQRYQGRSKNLRAKHNLPAYTGAPLYSAQQGIPQTR